MSKRRTQEPTPGGARFFGDVGAGELYVKKTGVTVSDPRICEAVAGGAPCPDDSDGTCELWLGDESRRVVQALGGCSMVLVEGDLGAGKSTVMYGVRALFRGGGQPYIHIDGHFLNRASKHGAAIKSATRHDRVVMIDSFDYGFLKQSIVSKARSAREVWLPALDEHRSNGGKVIVTSHTEPWLRAKTRPESLEMMMDSISDDAEVLRVGGMIDAATLASLAEAVCGKQFAARYLVLAADAPRTAYSYRVMKQIGIRLGDSLEGVTQDTFNATVKMIDTETREKMCADEDYDLC